MNTPSLTAVLHEDFKNPPSGLPGYTIAELLPRNYHTLMSELGRQPGHKLGADLVLPLMQKTGSIRALEFLAREMGGEFVPLPGKALGMRRATNQCIVTIKAFADLMGASSEALLDGRVTPEECTRVTKEGHEALQAILALMKAMELEVCND